MIEEKREKVRTVRRYHILIDWLDAVEKQIQRSEKSRKILTIKATAGGPIPPKSF